MNSRLEFRRVALTVSALVWTWAETAGLEIVEGHVLLALSATSGPVGASDVSSEIHVPLGHVYPALHGLTDRGYVYEQHRRHGLTAAGRRLVAAFDASYAPAAPAAVGSA